MQGEPLFFFPPPACIRAQISQGTVHKSWIVEGVSEEEVEKRTAGLEQQLRWERNDWKENRLCISKRKPGLEHRGSGQMGLETGYHRF